MTSFSYHHQRLTFYQNEYISIQSWSKFNVSINYEGQVISVLDFEKNMHKSIFSQWKHQEKKEISFWSEIRTNMVNWIFLVTFNYPSILTFLCSYLYYRLIWVDLWCTWYRCQKIFIAGFSISFCSSKFPAKITWVPTF